MGVDHILQSQKPSVQQQLKLVGSALPVENVVKKSRCAGLAFGAPYLYGKYQQHCSRSIE